jgi:hypothetical protein
MSPERDDPQKASPVRTGTRTARVRHQTALTRELPVGSVSHRDIIRCMDSHPVEFQEAAKVLGHKGHKLYTVVGPKGFQCLVDDTYNYSADEIVLLVKSGRPGLPEV